MFFLGFFLHFGAISMSTNIVFRYRFGKNLVLGAPDDPSGPLAKREKSRGRSIGAPLTLKPSPKT